jgi:hypothetical protein
MVRWCLLSKEPLPIGKTDCYEVAGIQEVSPRQKLSRRKVMTHILGHIHVVNAFMAGVPVPMIQKPG